MSVEYLEYLKKIPKEKRPEFEFLTQVTVQTYGIAINRVLQMNFGLQCSKQSKANTESIILNQPSSVFRYYKVKTSKSNTQKISFVDRLLKEEFFQHCNDEYLILKGSEIGAVKDLNRANPFGEDPDFATRGMGQNFSEDIAKKVENWIDHESDLPIHAFLAFGGVNVLGGDGLFYFTTKEGGTREVDGEEFVQITDATKAFFSSIQKDQLLFEVKGQNEKKNLSYLLKSSISIEEIFNKIKKEWEKNKILGKYQPAFLSVAKMDILPSSPDMPIHVSEFYHEHSPVLVFNEECKAKIEKGLLNEEDRTSYLYLDWIICNKRIALHEEILKIEAEIENEYQDSLENFLNRIPERFKKYQNFLNARDFHFQTKTMDKSRKLEVLFEQYLRCKHALEVLASPNEEPHLKMLKALKVLNELEALGHNFLNRFETSIKNNEEIFSSTQTKKEAKKKAEAFARESMKEEGEAIQLMLAEDILETLSEICLYNPKRSNNKYKITVTLEKFQLFLKKLNLYGTIAAQLTGSNDPGDGIAQIGSDIGKISHCLPKFLGSERDPSQVLEDIIQEVQEIFNGQFAAEQALRAVADLISKSLNFRIEFYDPTATYILKLLDFYEDDPQKLEEITCLYNKYKALQEPVEALEKFVNQEHRESRMQALFVALQPRIYDGAPDELLGNQEILEPFSGLLKKLKRLFEASLFELNGVWEGYVDIDGERKKGLKEILEGAKEILEDKEILLLKNIETSQHAMLFWFDLTEEEKVKSDQQKFGRLAGLFKGIIGGIRDFENQKAVNDVIEICKRYNGVFENIRRERKDDPKFFQTHYAKEASLTLAWIDMLTIPEYYRIEILSGEQAPKDLEEGVLYLQKNDKTSKITYHLLSLENDISGNPKHKHIEKTLSQDTSKELIESVTKVYGACENITIHKHESLAIFKEIASISRCPHNSEEKLQKIQEMVNEDLVKKTGLWDKFINEILEVLRAFGYGLGIALVSEKSLEETLGEDMRSVLDPWKEERDLRDEAIYNLRNA